MPVAVQSIAKDDKKNEPIEQEMMMVQDKTETTTTTIVTSESENDDEQTSSGFNHYHYQSRYHHSERTEFDDLEIPFSNVFRGQKEGKFTFITTCEQQMNDLDLPSEDDDEDTPRIQMLYRPQALAEELGFDGLDGNNSFLYRYIGFVNQNHDHIVRPSRELLSFLLGHQDHPESNDLSSYYRNPEDDDEKTGNKSRCYTKEMFYQTLEKLCANDQTIIHELYKSCRIPKSFDDDHDYYSGQHQKHLPFYGNPIIRIIMNTNEQQQQHEDKVNDGRTKKKEEQVIQKNLRQILGSDFQNFQPYYLTDVNFENTVSSTTEQVVNNDNDDE
ncbi:hypothetical protein BLA29_001001 [Euroglyphus maynei]|uniref:Uncharacterized protein n=1 Tax=Euroglyphus maynei TaxID=6958 RepID=A0A1Y3AYI6_EURMA|nr:hypothetical protein BLA29_001001 [Euroglyphus maynei]